MPRQAIAPFSIFQAAPVTGRTAGEIGDDVGNLAWTGKACRIGHQPFLPHGRRPPAGFLSVFVDSGCTALNVMAREPSSRASACGRPAIAALLGVLRLRPGEVACSAQTRATSEVEAVGKDIRLRQAKSIRQLMNSFKSFVKGELTGTFWCQVNAVFFATMQNVMELLARDSRGDDALMKVPGGSPA